MSKNLRVNSLYTDGMFLKTYAGGQGTSTIKIGKEPNALYGLGLAETDDNLWIQTWTPSGNAAVYMKATADAVTTDTEYDSLAVTVLGEGGTSLGGVTIPKSTAIVNLGKTGDGVILLSSDGYRPDGKDAPFIDIFTHQTEDKPWIHSPHVRLGKLLDILDITEDADTVYDEDGDEILNVATWGLAVGTDLSDSTLPHAIFSNKQMKLHNVKQVFTNAAGAAIWGVYPNAQDSDLFWFAGGSRSDPDISMTGDGVVKVSRLVIQGSNPTDTLFNTLGGAFLLGPRCPITTTSWTSTRGHSVTISGAFQQVAGPHENTRAIVVLPAETNECTNPVLNTALTGWTFGANTSSAWTTTYPYTGGGCCEAQSDGTTSGSLTVGPDAIYSFGSNIAAGTTYAGAVYVRTDDADSLGRTCYAEWRETGGATSTETSAKTVILTGVWQRIGVVRTIVRADRTAMEFHARVPNAITASLIYVDGATLGRSDVTLPDMWGSLDGVGWDGADYASTSTVTTATSLNASSHAATLLNNQAQLTFSLTLRMPRDYDEAGANVYLMEVADSASTTNRYSAYVNTSSELVISYRGQTLCQLELGSGNLTWRGGDWVKFVFVHDFAAGKHLVYANGKLINEKSISVARFTGMDYWRIADDYDGGAAVGVGVYEAAVFYSVLSRASVADLAERTSPLSDGRATEKPGLYILDGSFTLASSTSDQHMELTSTEMAAYDSSGNKDAWFDEDGLSVMADTQAAPRDIISVKFLDSGGSGVMRGKIWAYEVAGEAGVVTATYGDSDLDAYTYVSADTNKTNGHAETVLTATTDGGLSPELTVVADDLTAAEYVRSTVTVRIDAAVAIEDGMAAPSTLAGYAQIYVDTADGDLKVKFGDGTVKTIQAD